ncbi:MAG: pleD 2 [Gemmataceae bacterium]|nr:pleD 2 [Gemmataceae bacterium]
MPESVSETRLTPPKQYVPPSARGSCLVHIYPTGAAIGHRYPLGNGPLVIGRGDDCHIRLTDTSVSRRHARVEPGPDGDYVHDQGSTNGTFVDDRRVGGPCLLKDGDYLRVGNCIYRYLAGGNVEAEYHEEIYRLTILDGLTQAYNRRYLDEFLDREVTRSRRHARPLSVLMFDLDRFKELNDTHGHLCGDAVLRELAGLVRATVRQEDLFARYGGEEFALVLVETGPDEAMAAAERVRELVVGHPFPFGDATLRVTVSVGVATTAGDHGTGPDDLIRVADERIYQAKRAGRNRVVGGPCVPSG